MIRVRTLIEFFLGLILGRSSHGCKVFLSQEFTQERDRECFFFFGVKIIKERMTVKRVCKNSIIRTFSSSCLNRLFN